MGSRYSVLVFVERNGWNPQSYLMWVMPTVVLQMNLSSSMNMAGRMKITSSILTTAPRAISIHMELTISMSEYSATPKVAANIPMPETMMEGMEVARAVWTAVRLSC